jgi:acyl carrier protein phosphodiesterase
MISDFVKGKKQFDYPMEIQRGIRLHRAIDIFTDEHETTKLAKEFFRPHYRLYSGAMIDVAYDHFLANDINAFADKTELKNFTEQSYLTLSGYMDILPERFQKIFPYMQSQNWLYNYHHLEGMQKSFHGLVRRAAYLTDSSMADEVFKKNYNELEICFQQFFPELKNFASGTLSTLQK